MKRIFALTGIGLAVCALASAQDAGRIVVPAGNSSRPRVVDVSTANGSITVKTYEGKEVIVETGGWAHSNRNPPAPAGMHRIDIPDRGLEVEDRENTITVRNRGAGDGLGITVTVPVDTSLHLRSHNGAINVDGVHGEVDAETHNGEIHVLNVSGSVLANTHNAGIVVTMNRVDPAKPSAFSTLNGKLDVTLPADLKASLKMTTDNGSIYSDFDVTVNGGRASAQANNTADGRYRVRFDHTIQGSINGGGGADLTFRSANGSIMIHKKK
jgi:DUF4097 and DUF4098 domain-containing protein YvlB